ncbi:MAG: hypothetical protein E6G70_27810 [Alphaproteobacteria bacterium]|nr:MAG: hypothetical protein E6G70_27810 [Alphaproteobacteria bacterium]
MAVTQDKPVPYAPPTAILEIVSRRRNRGLPVPITSDVLGRASISPSLIPRTLQALQTLDLIDDGGNPTPTFEAIRVAPEAEYKRHLEEWLKSAYAEVFAFVDPAADDEVRIRDAFRSYNPAGQQDRMITLFQGLCSAAGLMPEKPTSASRSSAPRAVPPRMRIAPTTTQTQRVPPRMGLFQKPKSPTSLPPALSGLLESLPAASDGWTKDQREKFITTFQAVLDFCIPVVETHQTENGGQS